MNIFKIENFIKSKQFTIHSKQKRIPNYKKLSQIKKCMVFILFNYLYEHYNNKMRELPCYDTCTGCIMMTTDLNDWQLKTSKKN